MIICFSLVGSMLFRVSGLLILPYSVYYHDWFLVPKPFRILHFVSGAQQGFC